MRLPRCTHAAILWLKRLFRRSYSALLCESRSRYSKFDSTMILARMPFRGTRTTHSQVVVLSKVLSFPWRYPVASVLYSTVCLS